MRVFPKIVLLAIASFVASCVEPLALTPDIKGDIIAFEVEGQTRSSVNIATRTVNIEVGATVDLASVKITTLTLVETASADVGVGSEINLSSPLVVTVTTVADYKWTISASYPFDDNRRLPGAGFEDWYRADWDGTPNPGSKIWNPWPEGGVWEENRWWDTGNKGVSTLGDSNSIPTEPGEGCPVNPDGRAARLESKWMLIKAAGGNIYFGQFGEFTYPSLDATCHLGHNWQSKPSRLKGWYKYFPQPIDAVSDNHVRLNPARLSKQQWMGTMDSLHVCVALWASPDGRDIPFTVDTTPDSFVDFSRNAEGVIAYGGGTCIQKQNVRRV